MSQKANDAIDVSSHHSSQAGSTDGDPATPVRTLSFESILSASTALILAWDRSGRCLYASPAAASALGLRPDEVAGKTWRELGLPAGALAPFQERLAEVMETGQPATVALSLPAAGGPRAYEATLRRAREPEGGAGIVVTTLVDVSERPAAEAAREGERLRALIDTIPDELWFVDADENITLMNQAARRGLGLETQAQMPRSIAGIVAQLEVYEPDGQPRPPERVPLRRALRGETVSGEEIIRHTRTGELRHRHYYAAPLRGPDGRIAGAVALARDITDGVRVGEERDRVLADLREANEALVASSLRQQQLAEDAQRRAAELATTLESIADAVYVSDAQGRITMVNKAGLALTGAESRQALRTTADYEQRLQLRYQDGRPVPLEELAIYRALRGETEREREEVATHPVTGQRIDLLISAAPVRDAGGQITGAVEVARDVTRLRAVSEEAEQRAAELDATIGAINDGLITYGLHGEVVRMNEAAQRILGVGPEWASLPLEERLRQADIRTAAGERLPPGESVPSRALRGERVFGYRARVRRSDGELRQLLVSGGPMRDQEGRILGAVLSFGDITSLVELQELLDRRVAELDATLNAISSGLIIVAPPDVLVRMNRAAERLVGVTRRQWTHLLPNERTRIIRVETPDGRSLPLEETPRHRALHGEAVLDFHMVLRQPDGSRRDVLSNAAPIRDEAGHISGAVVNWADITPLIGLQELLDRRVAELDATINAAGDGLIIYDRQGRVLRMNQSAEELLGVTQAEYAALRPAAQEGILRIETPAGRTIAPEQTAQARALRGEVVLGIRERVRRRDGTTRELLVSAGPIRDEEGHLLGVVRSLSDVTPLVRLQEQVERGAAELETILGALGDGLVIYGAEGEVRRLNAAGERILGVSAAEWAATPPSERSALLGTETPDGQPLPLADWPSTHALRGETVVGYHSVIHRRDGARRHLRLTAAPARDAQGHIIAAVTTVADITPLVELQEQREDLLRAVSHDLRNPLAGVLGRAQLLERRLARAGLDRELRDAEAIATAARRMDTMIQDLVDAARSESGQIRLNRQPVDLHTFALTLMRRLAGSLETDRIDMQVPPDLPPADADPDRLERIITNLWSNALKYSTPGTPVTLSARQEDDRLIVSVTDRGPGISPEDLPRLFQRYYRTEAGRERKESVGLGLYITRQLVEAHGGTIWAESTLGEGSTFSLSLPVVGTRRN